MSDFKLDPYGSMESYQHEINKKHGPGTIVRGDQYINNSMFETGIFTLDYALCGGLPESQITMFVGWESSGKTTQALRAAGNLLNKYQNSNKIAFVADFEGTMDTSWSEALGVPSDRLWIANPVLGEAGVDMIVAAAEERETAIIIVDSLPAMTTEKETAKSAFDVTMPDRAKMISRFIGRMNAIITKRRQEGNPLTLLMINQYRHKVGITFGDDKVMPCGNAPRFMSYIIVEFRLKKEMEGTDEGGIDVVEANQHVFKLIKYKGPKNIKTGEFDMIRNHESDLDLGTIDDYKTVLGYAKKHDLLTGAGSSWKLDEVNQKFSKHEDIRQYLIDNEDEFRRLKAKLIILRRIQSNLTALPPDGYLYGWQNDEPESVHTSAQVEAEEVPEDGPENTESP